VTFEELLRNVPGFFILDTTEERLIGNRGTVGGGVQLLVNGVPQHQTRQKALTIPEIAHVNIPVESIDRIEIIRGPMSVIYGNNAFLGVINVVTNEIDRYGPRVSASRGSRDSGRLFARAGAQTEGGFIALNVGGYRTDGLDGAYADMLGADQLAALAPGMHASMDGDMPQQDLSLDLSAGWGDWTADLRYTRTDYGVYLLTPSFDDGNQLRLNTWHLALGWEHAVADNLGLRASAIASEERVDVGEYDFISPGFGGTQQAGNRRWELELDLLWDPRPNLNLLAGYRFRLVDGIENRAAVPPLLDTNTLVEGFTTHDLFTELSWRPTERLRLIGGVRLSRQPAEYRFTRDDYLAGTRTEQDYAVPDPNLVTGRVAALWSLDAYQVVKLVWGTAAQDNDQIQFPEPERIETAELVYQQARRDWMLSASLFRNRTSNLVRVIQEFVPATGDYRAVDDNSGEWTTHGLELIGELRPLPALNLSASATWQDTQDDDTGIDPGYSPALLVKLKADYSRGAFTYATYAYYVGAMEPDWNFVDGTRPGITERVGERVDGYWNLGANLRYRHPHNGLYADLNVSNLLDAEIRYPAKEFADFERGLIGPGRIITATVGWEF
jgi:outer membrane receptor protein involved in Fe transport